MFRRGLLGSVWILMEEGQNRLDPCLYLILPRERRLGVARLWRAGWSDVVGEDRWLGPGEKEDYLKLGMGLCKGLGWDQGVFPSPGRSQYVHAKFLRNLCWKVTWGQMEWVGCKRPSWKVIGWDLQIVIGWLVIPTIWTVSELLGGNIKCWSWGLIGWPQYQWELWLNKSLILMSSSARWFTVNRGKVPIESLEHL